MKFENRIINGIHLTRYIASWTNSGGSLSYRGINSEDFGEWLKSLGLSEEDIYDIVGIARNGKMELEQLAKQFIKNKSL